MVSKKILIAGIAIILLVSSIILIRINTNTTKNIGVDVDCRVGEFGEFSSCTRPCGGGFQTKNRTILVPPAGTGDACPSLTEVAECNTQVCPVDCQVGDFGEFSTCTRPCGGGFQTRNRTILVPPAGTGAACPPLTQTAACNTQPCPVDCELSGYGEFSPCSRQCGGTKTRNRSVVVPPVGGGAACLELTETVECSTEDCIELVMSTVDSLGSFGMPECGIVTQIIGDLSVNDGNVAVVQSIRLNSVITSLGISRDIKFGLYIQNPGNPIISKISSTTFFSIFEGLSNTRLEDIFYTINDDSIRFVTGDILGLYIEGCEEGGNYGLDRINVYIKYYTICG